MANHLLILLLFLPLAGAIALAFIRSAAAVRWTAFATTMAAFLAAMSLFIPFHWRLPVSNSSQGVGDQNAYGYVRTNSDRPTVGGVQLIQRAEITRAWHVQFLLGIDGLSLPLVLAAALIFGIVVIASWNMGSFWGEHAAARMKLFFVLLLLLEMTVLGVFLSLDYVLFWFFFTASWVLLAWLTAVTNPAASGRAVTLLVVYMLASSILLLIVLPMLQSHVRPLTPDGRGSCDLAALAGWRVQNALAQVMPAATSQRLFLMLLAAFLLRMGAFPLHYWRSDFHAAASTPINMLSGITLLATGGYGLLRIAWPLFPVTAAHLSWPIALLGMIALFYGGLCALSQRDLNRLLAYISVAVGGLFLLGCAVLSEAAIRGAMMTLIAWSITSATLFFISGILFERFRHRIISRCGGLAQTMSFYFQFACAAFLAGAGLPAFAPFIGQMLIVLGIFQGGHTDAAHAISHSQMLVLGVLTCIGLLLVAGGLLWTMQRIFLGPPRAEHGKSVRELDARETLTLSLLLLVSFLLGILPGVFVLGYADATLSGWLGLFWG